MSYVRRSRSSKRSSAVPSWRCVACTRLVLGSSVRSPARQLTSTSTASSASSCVTVRCSMLARVPCTTCAARPRPEPMISTASPRSHSLSDPPARRVLHRSPEFLAASRLLGTRLTPLHTQSVARFTIQHSSRGKIMHVYVYAVSQHGLSGFLLLTP